MGLFAAVGNGNALPVLKDSPRASNISFLAIMPSADRVSRWRKRGCGTSGSIGCCRTSVSICAPSGFPGRLGTPWLESNSGTDGVRTFTPGVHVVRLAWGRMTYIGIYPDTVGVVTTLQRLSRAGVAEATAEKIEG
jgi:hypothetical protein